MARRDKRKADMVAPWRLAFVFLAMSALFAVTVWKVLDLQVLDNEVLQRQGDARTVRTEVLAANRGNIMDRNGEPLAISTPVLSLWLNPKEVLGNERDWPRLAQALQSIGVDAAAMRRRIESNAGREFLYVQRRMPPAEAQAVLDLRIKGVYALEEYKRFYPLGEVAAHIVGLTNADDVGQEGLELAYEDWLRGQPGSRQVLKDRLGGIISELRVNAVAQPGNDLELGIDSRIQYLAYKALKEDVTMRRASSGSAVVLDVRTGEVLAMVNQPSYNPNNRSSIGSGETRNRAMVDVMEPGSTAKAFTVAAALETGLFSTSSIIDTNPGYVRVYRSTIRDPVNYGLADLDKIIAKSSQVGATKLALAMGQEPMLDVLARVGFGQAIGTGFPGEAAGMLPNRPRWSQNDIASMGFGYGFQVTPLQLAQAYLVFANGGIRKPVSLLKVDGEVQGERVIDAAVVRDLVPMLESVVSREKGGTGVAAAIPGYRVAGKSGTTWYFDVARGGYDGERYVSHFAGFVPATDPRIVIVVTIQEPKGEQVGGGQVAAPVFHKIAAGAMRILNVAPDIPGQSPRLLDLTAAPALPALELAR